MRGARQRALLGLMVADQMLEQPLEHREFRRLAAGGEEEPERARKTMNMAVYRLREVIGEEGVLTDDETPRLNLQHLQIDLLDAAALLRKARAALRDGALMRAFPALREALDITRGEVSFPTLYDDFFEAAREDFEFELRSAIIDIARRLMIEGDPASAEEILRRGYDGMPGDEELADMLCEALESSGKRTAAERIRMQTADAAAM
jgi:DNA-binding SARP family transcriptional activator